MLGQSFWATTAFRLKPRLCRTAWCMFGGNKSRMRLIVLHAVEA